MFNELAERDEVCRGRMLELAAGPLLRNMDRMRLVEEAVELFGRVESMPVSSEAVDRCPRDDML